MYSSTCRCKGGSKIQQEPAFGTSKHYGKTHGSLLSGQMSCKIFTMICLTYYISNILIVDHNFLKGGLKVTEMHQLFKVLNTGTPTLMVFK